MTTPTSIDSPIGSLETDSATADMDKPLEGGNAKSESSRKPKAPFFDGDINDIVPVYTDSDSWYEP